MNLLVRLFLRGLVAILPLALTGYLVYAAVVAGEKLLHEAVLLFLREEDYWPGMGFALSIVLVMAVGLLMYSFVIRQIYQRLTALLERIPIVKSIYGMLVDVVQLFGNTESRPPQRVVLVRMADGSELVGFVTRDDFTDHPDFGVGKIAVYLPMSYQLGGYTLIVDAERVRSVAMPAEEAMRFCVTAGVARRSV